MEIRKTKQFKKDYKKIVQQGHDQNKMAIVLDLLLKDRIIPVRYRDHFLNKNKEYDLCRELHIEPDWLLIYKRSDDGNVLYLVRTGSHSDLF
ncbi:MAG: type II toxin-antitoxin system YafQ family toxin [Erysipelotrichaceae bacterium]|nr:type II toxin-antitoxin system YafQ family toxin [Erysipelotrichaceae bacterium]